MTLNINYFSVSRDTIGRLSQSLTWRQLHWSDVRPETCHLCPSVLSCVQTSDSLLIRRLCWLSGPARPSWVVNGPPSVYFRFKPICRSLREWGACFYARNFGSRWFILTPDHKLYWTFIIPVKTSYLLFLILNINRYKFMIWRSHRLHSVQSTYKIGHETHAMDNTL